MNRQIEQIKDSLDGTNLELVLTELGVRFHRVILENIYQFTYSIQGNVIITHFVGGLHTK